jgi:hypothetical protein
MRITTSVTTPKKMPKNFHYVIKGRHTRGGGYPGYSKTVDSRLQENIKIFSSSLLIHHHYE